MTEDDHARPSSRSTQPARARDGRASVVFSLGGNVGDKEGALRRALGALGSEPGIELAPHRGYIERRHGERPIRIYSSTPARSR